MATVKEKGKIVFMGEIQSGTSQNGNGWARQTVVLDVAGYNGTYRKIALQAGTQQVQDLQEMQVGDLVEVSYQVTAREWQGKWYNNVDLYKIDFVEEQPQIQQPVAPAYPQNPQYPQPNMQQFVQNGMYPAQPAPAPAAPAQPRRRGRVPSQPQIPANTPMNLQTGDLPPEIFEQ